MQHRRVFTSSFRWNSRQPRAASPLPNLAALVALSGFLALPSPHPTFADGCPQPPDQFTNACYLGTVSPAVGTVQPPYAQNFYRFEVPAGTTAVHLALTGLSADLDLYLYDASQQQITTAIMSGSADEHLDGPLASGQYYVAVVGAQGESASYALSLEIEASQPPLASLADGTFVKGSGPQIYWMAGGQRHLIPNWETFLSLGGAADQSNVRVLTEDQVAAIPDGSPIAPVVTSVRFAALADFGAEQGNRGWRYQSFDTRNGTYLDLSRYGGASCGANRPQVWFDPKITCLQVGRVEPGDLERVGLSGDSLKMHPGSEGSEAYESTLSWVAPQTGEAVISGWVAKDAIGGNGVDFTVWKNNELVSSLTLADPDHIRHPLNLAVSLSSGDWLHFRVGAREDGHFDTVVVAPVVTLTP